MGTKPPGKVKSMDFRWFQGPAGAEPPGKEKNKPPLDKFLITLLMM